MHAFEDILGTRNSGRFSDGHQVGHLLQSYLTLRKKKLHAKNYFDAAYISGFTNGLAYFLSDEKARQHFPFYYVFGHGEIESLEEYARIAKSASNLHKSAYSYASRLASPLRSDGTVVHHIPFV